MEAKDLIVVNFDDGDLVVPAALMGCVFITKRDVYDMTFSEVLSLDIAVAFLDVCGVGIPRGATTFKKSIDAFRRVPILIETHSVYASKYQLGEKWGEMLRDYRARHESGLRLGECTQVVPYPGKSGNRSKMLLASSVLEGFDMPPFEFRLPRVEKKMPPTSASAPALPADAARSAKRRRDDDGPPSMRTRVARKRSHNT